MLASFNDATDGNVACIPSKGARKYHGRLVTLRKIKCPTYEHQDEV